MFTVTGEPWFPPFEHSSLFLCCHNHKSMIRSFCSGIIIFFTFATLHSHEMPSDEARSDNARECSIFPFTIVYDTICNVFGQAGAHALCNSQYPCFFLAPSHVHRDRLICGCMCSCLYLWIYFISGNSVGGFCKNSEAGSTDLGGIG
jgi:hypothetical protein